MEGAGPALFAVPAGAVAGSTVGPQAVAGLQVLLVSNLMFKMGFNRPRFGTRWACPIARSAAPLRIRREALSATTQSCKATSSMCTSMIAGKGRLACASSSQTRRNSSSAEKTVASIVDRQPQTVGMLRRQRRCTHAQGALATGQVWSSAQTRPSGVALQSSASQRGQISTAAAASLA